MDTELDDEWTLARASRGGRQRADDARLPYPAFASEELHGSRKGFPAEHVHEGSLAGSKRVIE